MMELFVNTYSYIAPGSGMSLTELYRSLAIDYPKFFKMDNLSKLGFLAAEMLENKEEKRFMPREDVDVICFNSSSSLDTDIMYQRTIGAADFFPSPSLFVYTLANIVTGEIAIRNKFLGETSFYICKEWNAETITRIVGQAIEAKPKQSAIVAWLEYGNNTYEAFMMKVSAENTGGPPFTAEATAQLLAQLRDKSNKPN